MNQMDQLKEIIEKSSHIVFFGGAGVSTESGIPDFRSQDGLYNQVYKYPPEKILSLGFFNSNPKEYFRFYRDKMLNLDAEPNNAHKALVELEKKGKLLAVVTQNIDGLHQKAGSKHVYELHGTIHSNHCCRCQQEFSLPEIMERMDASKSGIPHCDCTGIIKPDVVLYEEMLPQDTVSLAIKAISMADTLIVAGTSMQVYPANTYVKYYFRGNNLIVINREKIAFDDNADLVIHDSVGDVLSYLLE